MTSGSFKNVQKAEVEKVLSDNENEILQGILLFKQTDETKTKTSHPAEISEFLKRTATHLVNINLLLKKKTKTN